LRSSGLSTLADPDVFTSGTGNYINICDSSPSTSYTLTSASMLK